MHNIHITNEAILLSVLQQNGIVTKDLKVKKIIALEYALQHNKKQFETIYNDWLLRTGLYAKCVLLAVKDTPSVIKTLALDCYNNQINIKNRILKLLVCLIISLVALPILPFIVVWQYCKGIDKATAISLKTELQAIANTIIRHQQDRPESVLLNKKLLLLGTDHKLTIDGLVALYRDIKDLRHVMKQVKSAQADSSFLNLCLNKKDRDMLNISNLMR